MSPQRVVITGIGVVSPNGIGADPFAQACIAGRSGLSVPTIEPPYPLKTSSVGAVTDLDVRDVMDEVDLRRVPRLVPMALAAAREAMSMARLSLAEDDLPARQRIAIILGTGGGGLAFVEEQFRNYFRTGRASPFSVTAGTHGNLSSELSIQLRLRGPSHVITSGCASSTDAVGYALLLLRAGAIDAAIVGGADSPISPAILAAFERMQVVSTRRWDSPAQASRPFDSRRDGFVLGEGAWMFVLEREPHAITRGATMLAEVAGYGSTCDAYHRVQIAPDLVESTRAIELALADAGAEPADIDYVNLHGTSTDMNDRLETAALRRSLGDHAGAIPMSSTKSMIGHPQGACGAAGMAAAVLCARLGLVHPTINLTDPDPLCDLDYVPNTARAAAVRTILCNCIAFGSKNSALVLRV